MTLSIPLSTFFALLILVFWWHMARWVSRYIGILTLIKLGEHVIAEVTKQSGSGKAKA